MTGAPVQDSVKVSELDLRLVHALQVNPRATWAQVARVLEVDAATLGRRWGRLTSAGAAWVSCQPLVFPEQALAFVEIGAAPGRIFDVAQTLARDPQAMTIDIAAGARDLLVTVACADARLLADYLLERVSRVPHVARVQSQVLVRAYTEASRWRLRALGTRQENALSDLLPGVDEDRRVRVAGPLDDRLVAALSVDGRRPLGELAAATGTSESTVRRRLNALLGSGVLRLRCELARDLTEWRVSEWFFLRVPPDRIDEAGQVLAGVPEVRAVLSAAGPANLLVAVWLHTVADGQRLETQLMRRLPHVEVVDRSVVIRPYKLVGRLLDARGYAVGVVPLDLAST